MPYSAEISRRNPSCILFLLDQSGSMADRFPNRQGCKADDVATTTNRILSNVIVLCTKGDDIRDYFHIGVIGYGGKVGSVLGGPFAGRDIVPVSELGRNPVRVEERKQKVEDGIGGLVEQNVRFPVWIDPVTENGTPMCAALTVATHILGAWLGDHADCFPPTVIHVTDGEATDGDPREAFAALTGLTSSDGPVMLFNVHLSSNPTANKLEWPDAKTALPDQYAQMLFDTASTLLPSHRALAAEQGKSVSEGSKAFVLNADLVSVIEAFEIGTRPANLR